MDNQILEKEVKTMKTEKGFTLVEMAIVMLIIGLLAGGILAGASLIDNMKISSTVQLINSTESAALKFKDTYGTIPGDVKNPSTVLPNCANLPCSYSNPPHNGDGVLMAPNVWTFAITSSNERAQFWQQLLATDMISGISPTTSLVFGEGQPLTALDVGLRAFYDYTIYQHGVCLTNIDTNAIGGVSADDLVLKGSDASKLDKKLDDGVPNTGRFTAWDSTATSPATYTINTNYGARYLYNF